MNKIIAAVSTLIVVFLGIALFPFTTIPTGSVGLVEEWSSYKGEDLKPGWHFLAPLRDNVVTMNLQTQTYQTSAVAYTKDQQTLTVRVSLQYNIDEKEAGKLYNSIGLGYEAKVVRPVLEEAMLKEIAQVAAIEFPGKKGSVSDAIEMNLRSRLASSHLNVVDFTIDNEDYDDDYEAAIKARQVQEQKALEAKNVTAQVEEKTKQEKLAADAMAYKTQKEVEALKIGGDEYVRKLEAEALKIEAEASLEFAKHWLGNVPAQVTIVSSGEGSTPTIPFLPLK